MKTEFAKFLKLAGSQNKAGEILNVKPAMISHIKTSKRGLTPANIAVICRRYPEIDYLRLIDEQAR